MPVPSPEPSGGEPKSKNLGRPPQDKMVLDTLRSGLYAWRASAEMGHKVWVAIDDIGCQIKNSTSDDELEGFIQKVVRTSLIKPKENFFRKKGRFWVFAYLGAEEHVADLLGVTCIVYLLYHPNPAR